MRRGLTAFLLAVAVSTGAAEGLWFGFSFSDYRPGEALSNRGAANGAWQPWATGLAVTNTPAGTFNAMAFAFDSCWPRVQFVAEAPATDEVSSFELRLNPHSAIPLDSAVPDGALALTFVEGTETNAVDVAAAVGGRWVRLRVEGVAFERRAWYDLRIVLKDVDETRLAGFFVKQGEAWVRLADIAGTTWFVVPRTCLQAASRVEISGHGAFGDFAAHTGTVSSETSDCVWAGGSAGDWTNRTAWALGQVPVTGNLVRVNGVVSLTRGEERATVSNAVFRVRADETLELVHGALATETTLDVNRPRAGKALTVKAPSFAGISPAVEARWSRSASTAAVDFTVVSWALAYVPTPDDYEHWFSCTVRDALGRTFTKKFFFSKLPVCYLSTDDGATPSENKEEHAGHLLVQGNDEFKGGMYDGAMTIKVRGNSTSKYVKKPYKIRLDEKTKMFGLGKKNRHWVLLANYNDMSQLRNKLAYDFANEIGVLGMRSTWVDCVLNGEFIGCYQFCEHIRVDEDRVNIFNWEDFAEDAGMSTTNLSWVDSARASDPSAYDISGGYLFEFSDENDEVSGFTISTGLLKIPTMVHAPEYVKTSPQMYAWCKSLLQNFFTANVSLNHLSGEDRHWSWYADVDSMVNYWLDVELFGNKDPRFKSRYAYIDIGRKMKMGPVWDFDWGSDSCVVSGDSSSDPEAWACTNGPRPLDSTWKNENAWVVGASFLKEWTSDPYFLMKAYERYWEIREKFVAVIEEGGVLDQAAEFLKPVLAANDARWPRTRGNVEDTARLRSYYRRRLPWLDRQFKSVPRLMASLAVDWQTTPYVVDPVRIRPSVEERTYAIRAQLQRAATVEVLVNGERLGVYHVVHGRFGEVRIPRSMLTPRVGKLNCISFISYGSTGAPVARNYLLVPTSPAGTTFILR